MPETKHSWEDKTIRLKKEGGSYLLPSGESGRVEEASLAHFKQLGWDGLFGEHFFWQTLTALLFWDQIFAQLDGVYSPQLGNFPSERQDMPRDLFQKEFYARRQNLIESHLQSLLAADLNEYIKQTHSTHHGTPCRLIEDWNQFERKDFLNVVGAFSSECVLKICHRLLKNVDENRRGLPDLILWRSNHGVLAEVKSPTDSLRDSQVHWLSFLCEAGVDTWHVSVEVEEDNEAAEAAEKPEEKNSLHRSKMATDDTEESKWGNSSIKSSERYKTDLPIEEYFPVINKIQAFRKQGNYRTAFLLCLEQVGHIPEFVDHQVNEYGAFDISSIPSVQLAIKYLASLGDVPRLEKVKTTMDMRPQLDSWAEQANEYADHALEFREVIEFIEQNSGVKQTDLWDQLNIDGRVGANLIHYAEQLGGLETSDDSGSKRITISNPFPTVQGIRRKTTTSTRHETAGASTPSKDQEEPRKFEMDEVSDILSDMGSKLRDYVEPFWARALDSLKEVSTLTIVIMLLGLIVIILVSILITLLL